MFQRREGEVVTEAEGEVVAGRGGGAKPVGTGVFDGVERDSKQVRQYIGGYVSDVEDSGRACLRRKRERSQKERRAARPNKRLEGEEAKFKLSAQAGFWRPRTLRLVYFPDQIPT